MWIVLNFGNHNSVPCAFQASSNLLSFIDELIFIIAKKCNNIRINSWSRGYYISGNIIS